MFASITRPLRKILLDLFTGPDGKTWAIGRFYSVPVLVTGLAAPIMMIVRGQPVNLADVGVEMAGVAGACLLLIRGTNEVDLSDPAHPRPLQKD